MHLPAFLEQARNTLRAAQFDEPVDDSCENEKRVAYFPDREPHSETARKIIVTFVSGFVPSTQFMTDKIVVFSTCASEEEAESIARKLIETHVAACVNIVPGVRSFYRWK